MTNIDLIAKALEYRPEVWKGENRDIATHLSNAGVFVPPCKLGDTVYWINGGKRKYITAHKVVGFIIGNDGIRLDLGDFQPKLGYERLFLDRDNAINKMKER